MPKELAWGYWSASSLVGLMAGYGFAVSKARHWMHAFCLVAAVATTIYVIADMERPRAGWIVADSVDQVLIDLRVSI